MLHNSGGWYNLEFAPILSNIRNYVTNLCSALYVHRQHAPVFAVEVETVRPNVRIVAVQHRARAVELGQLGIRHRTSLRTRDTQSSQLYVHVIVQYNYVLIY